MAEQALCVGCGGPADTDAMSEEMRKAAERDGALALSFTIAVLPSQHAELRAEGERVWRDRWTWPPADWSDEDYIRYALAQRMRGGEAR